MTVMLLLAPTLLAAARSAPLPPPSPPLPPYRSPASSSPLAWARGSAARRRRAPPARPTAGGAPRSAVPAQSCPSPLSSPLSSAAAAAAAAPDGYYSDLMLRFQGDFDNYGQVVSDRSAGLTPREGGGHEHIHCSLVPVDVESVRGRLRGGHPPRSGGGPEDRDAGEEEEEGGEGWSDARLAAFYFDGVPRSIFRFRLYAVRRHPEGALMRLYALGPETEGTLRGGYAGRPDEWRGALRRILGEGGGAEGRGGAGGSGSGGGVGGLDFSELVGCDVLWTRRPDPSRHPYVECSRRFDDAAHAVMVNEEAVVPSQMVPGTTIRIVDELSLWDDELWINDRGFDPHTGEFVYGNHRGVPYKLRRVATYLGGGDDGDGCRAFAPERRVTDEALAWTLGLDFRTEECYRQKMDAIGGPSTRRKKLVPLTEEE